MGISAPGVEKPSTTAYAQVIMARRITQRVDKATNMPSARGTIHLAKMIGEIILGGRIILKGGGGC